MSRTTFITLLSIVTLIAALGFQYRRQTEIAEKTAKADTVSEPDFYLTDATTTEFNKSGDIRYRFDAKQLQHFAEGDYTLVDDPDITLYHSDGVPWYVTAKQGSVSAGHEQIKLWETVWLRRGTPRDPLDLKTEALDIFPQQDIAQTDRDVVINNKRGRVDATGLKAYIDQDRMELLSNVRVRHEPVNTR